MPGSPFARLTSLLTIAILGATGVTPLMGQVPSKPDQPVVRVFGTIQEKDPMGWGPPPPGTRHAARARAYDLQHQIVRVAFDWSRHVVVGSTTLRIGGLARPVDRMQLDAVGMSIKSVKSAGGEDLPHEYDGRVLTIRLGAALRAGDTTNLTVDYETVRPKAGVYFVERRHVVWTQGKLEDNRYWVPTYDFPNDKTTWELFVRSAANERAFAVGSLAGQRPVDGGIEWHWVQDTPAPTYLMTVAVGPYAVAEDSAGPVRLHYWAYADSLASARSGFAPTSRIIEILSRKLGTPFPSPGFDQIVVSDFIFWDWLESWRPVIATTVHDEQLIVRGGQGWPGEDAEMAIARLVAQQWFGKLVTPADWSHVWLSDGIANFLAHVYAEEAHGTDAARGADSWLDVATFAADRDARRPLVYDRWQNGPIELLLTEHVGQKSAAVLRMLRRELGDSAFWGGMRRYLTDHANGTVTTADFEHAMEQASGRDLTGFFRQWVYGAGFPFLRVTFRYDSSAKGITFTAEQYQRRDTLTGFFDASVDVEVLTERGPARARMPLHGERSTFTFALPSVPRAIRWDPDKWLRSEVELTRPTDMLLYQLEHDANPGGRREAVLALGERAIGMDGSGGIMSLQTGNLPPLAHPEIAAALLRAARSDTSLGVRIDAVEAMALLHVFSGEITTALLELTRDREAEVRLVAALGLAGPPDPRVSERITEMARSDPDSLVRSQVLNVLSSGAPVEAYALAKQRLESASASEEYKAHLLMLVTDATVPGGWNIARKYLTDPKSSRPVREAAMHALGIGVFMSRFNPGPDPNEVVNLLAPFLASEDPSLRLSAARELGQVKIPTARAALESRKRVEVDARVLREIDQAIAEMSRPEPGIPRRHDE
jgi:aminopeptidase N